MLNQEINCSSYQFPTSGLPGESESPYAAPTYGETVVTVNNNNKDDGDNNNDATKNENSLVDPFGLGIDELKLSQVPLDDSDTPPPAGPTTATTTSATTSNGNYYSPPPSLPPHINNEIAGMYNCTCCIYFLMYIHVVLPQMTKF